MTSEHFEYKARVDYLDDTFEIASFWKASVSVYCQHMERPTRTLFNISLFLKVIGQHKGELWQNCHFLGVNSLFTFALCTLYQ